jgi:serine/threonine protein kinase
MNEFKSIKRISVSSRSIVFRAVKLNRQEGVPTYYAIKRLFRPSPHEITNLGRVQTHHNVVRLDEVFVQDGYGHIVMEYLPVMMYHNFPVAVMTDVIAAVSHCHKRGILHGDIHIENVGFDGQTYKLINFGSSVRLNDNIGVYDRIYSRRVFPPEFNANYPIVRTDFDVWCLGMMAKGLKLPQRFMPFVEKCTCPNPRERLRSKDLLKSWMQLV